MKNIASKIGFVLLPWAAYFTNAAAQQPVKVLFIGNSFTYYPSGTTSLPAQFKGLCTAAGKTVTTDMDANAGQYFEGAGGHATSAATYAKIHSQAWDYVVLQDNQGYFAGYVNQVGASHMAANIQVRDSVRAIHPCAKVIWFAGWAYLGGIPSQIPGDNTVKMNARIDTNYQYMQDQYPAKKELIAPFGKTWNNAIQAQPSIESLLYISDGVHPSATGQLSNASVLYTMIFKQDPSNINYVPSGVTAANAALLRNMAYQTVMTPYLYNSHQMPQITPVVANNSGVLSVSGNYSAYQWYLNNVAIAGATSSTYTPTANGSYMVIATTTSNNCPQNWSFPIVVTATGIEENIHRNNVVLYPNPVTDKSVIELNDMEWDGGRIEITDIFGHVIESEPLTSKMYFIYKRDFQPGIYIYKITDKAGNDVFGKIHIF